jgi:hypothetical protein
LNVSLHKSIGAFVNDRRASKQFFHVGLSTDLSTQNQSFSRAAKKQPNTAEAQEERHNSCFNYLSVSGALIFRACFVKQQAVGHHADITQNIYRK